MVIVAGRLVVITSETGTFFADLVSLAGAARSASGCLLFALGADHDAADAALLVEKWNDPEAHRAFLQTSAFVQFSRTWGTRIRNELVIAEVTAHPAA